MAHNIESIFDTSPVFTRKKTNLHSILIVFTLPRIFNLALVCLRFCTTATNFAALLFRFIHHFFTMGIHGLAKVIGDYAPSAVKENEIKNYFGEYACLRHGVLFG